MDTTTPTDDCTSIDPSRFRHDCVRDLAWAVFSPPMVTAIATARGTARAPDFAPTGARLQWLRALDADPTPLLEHLQSVQSRFLGIYFEALWRYFLLHDNDVTLLRYNRQLIDNGRTLGEFDILYHCHRRDLTVHLELAVKFYLGMPVADKTDLHHAQFWLGPNCADRLDLKLAHLRTHQLALLDHHIARHWLDAEQLKPTEQEIALHGYLYYPWPDVTVREAYAPRDASPTHLSSFWLRAAALARLHHETANECHYRIVPKMQWLCTHDNNDNDHAWHDFATVSQMIAQEFVAPLRQPVLCEEARLDNRHVTRRFFVAPDDWPALHWPRRKF